MNRLIADSGFFDDIDSAGNHPGEASKGVAKGTANGFIFIGNQLIDTDIRGQREGPIPYFELDNSAQRGGANIGAIVETALAGKGLVKIGAKKWLIRNGDELSEIVVKNADEIGAGVHTVDGVPRVVSSETADAISGLGPEAVSHNRSAISQYDPGSGFSGVFDPDTGKFLAYPSGETVLASGDVPANRVSQYGGHRDVNQALSEVDGLNPNRLGFSMTLDASGEFVVGFNSRQVNLPNPNFQGHTVPGPMRQQILDAIEQSTGRKARQVEN